MGAPDFSPEVHPVENALGRGVDFSGLTVVLGVGTGRLVELLNQQAASSGGNLIVVSTHIQHLKRLTFLSQQGPLVPIHARLRHVPVLNETVDLLVVNGVLREVPENKLGALFEEFWRILVPGGKVRISDIIEPSEADYDRAWAERNRIVRKLSQALQRPAALSVDLKRVALAMRSVGFEELSISILPGLALTDAWLQETINAVRNMTAGIVDRRVRDEILTRDISSLVAAYSKGEQRAPGRFVLQGNKVGDIALNMEAPFTEEDLVERD